MILPGQPGGEAYHPFRDYFEGVPTNNPDGYTKVAAYLDEFASIFAVAILPGLTNTVRAAERGAAALVGAVLCAKRENIDLGFRDMIDKATGKSFAAKLLN